jgi:carboxylesterase type B
VDSLNCLRKLPYQLLLRATNSPSSVLSYSSLALNYVPRPDGRTLTASPDRLALDGKIAKVPFILGDQEDEGTFFALFQSNITTKAELVHYLYKYYFSHSSPSQLNELVDLYSDISTNGSPFRTGLLNNWYPQFKQLAGILGDLTFTLTRRVVLHTGLDVFPKDVPFWSYLSSYDYGTPILGTFHGSDILQVFFGIRPDYASSAFHSYYISFINHLDPNKAGNVGSITFPFTSGLPLPKWPTYRDGQKLLNVYPDIPPILITDDFRGKIFNFLSANITSFYF